jgi:DNA helicase-2/ATP-dependent DNA helicase PcrA
MARNAASIPGLKDKAARALEDFARLMDDLATIHDQAADEVIRRLLTETGYREHLAAEAEGKAEDRLANLDELITAAREFDQVHPGSSIQDFLAEITLSSPIDRWDQETGAVTVMTLHAAKGLEFPVVFIVALEEGLLPHSRAFENDDEVEEERRLLFVGITRARRELSLSRCCVRSFRGQQQATLPSRFLAELPEEPMVVRDLSGIGSFDMRPQSEHGSWSPPRNPARPATASPGFRLMTAADLRRDSSPGDSPRTPAPVDLDAMVPGVSVLHPQYGLGRIMAVEGLGPNRKARVAFAVGPARTFVLARAPLRPVARSAPEGPPSRMAHNDGRA